MSSPIGFLDSERDLPPRNQPVHTEIVEFSVSLRVTGETLDLEGVTVALAHTPTDIAEAGQLLRQHGRHKLRASTGTWFSKLGKKVIPPTQRLEWSKTVAPNLLQALKGVHGIEAIELSFLLNGDTEAVVRFVERDSYNLAEGLTAEAAYLPIDLDAPTAGVEIVLGKGQILNVDDLRTEFGLSAIGQTIKP